MTPQQTIDSIAYPPTHTYNFNTLTPRDILAQRVAITPMDFFGGNRLLDVGCNKCFFSMYSSSRFKEVVGIDSVKQYVDFGNQIAKHNTKFIHTTFKDFWDVKQFDRIYFGNVHHYMYRECGDWSWIHKLAALSNGEVLIEGPIDSTCKDVVNCMPKDLLDNYTFDKFMEVMSNYFELVLKIPTVSYTPDRFIMHFKKKCAILTGAAIEKTYNNHGTDDDLNYSENNPVSVSICGSSPIANKVYDVTEHGWKEQKISENPYRYFEHEVELLRRICDHEIYLAKLGYWDMDTATINFFNPSGIFFDKGSTMPIQKICAKRIECFKILFAQSYKKFSLPNALIQALESKDAVAIQQQWTQFKNEI